MNMNSITINIKLIINYIRLKKLQFLCNNFHFERWTNISSKTDVEIAKNSNVMFGRGLHTRQNVIIAVREEAELSIGRNVFINRNTIITCHKRIIIGDNVMIGPNCCFYDHDHNVTNLSGGDLFLIM